MGTYLGTLHGVGAKHLHNDGFSAYAFMKRNKHIITGTLYRQVKPTSGDIHQPGALEQVLASIAFKKEVSHFHHERGIVS